MILDKLIGEIGGMCGIGGNEQQTHGAGPAKKGNSFDQIGDSFKNGDIMGGIGQILGMVTGMGSMGGMGGGGGGMNVTEMMDPTMFMDPLTKEVFKQICGQGYAKQEPSKSYGSPTVSSTGSGQPVKAAPTYDEQYAAALGQVSKYFDLLDTSAGVNGKDGLIGRCDLEAALKNISLPTELKNACYFLLQNPAAFNQLDVSAGIGKCDGLIGKCDVDAALAAQAKKAEKSEKPKNEKLEEAKKKEGKPGREEIRNEKSGKADGQGGTSKADSGGECEVDEADETKGAEGISNPFENMDAEEIIDEIVHSLDDQMEDVASQLKTTTNERERAELMEKLQKLATQRKEMYDLLSNLIKVEHEMTTTAINNIGRI